MSDLRANTVSDPESREKHKRRRRNKYAKDLRTPKYKQRIQKGRPQREPPEIEEFDIDGIDTDQPLD